jgi:uncharacterized protein (TIGR03437 family)
MNRSRRRFLKIAAGGAAASLGSPAHAATIQRFPYLQDVRTDRATIMWCTNEQNVAAIEFSADPAAPRWTRVPARSREFRPSQTGLSFSFHQHVAEITELRAATQYFYRVLADGLLLEADGLAFRTAPASDGFLFLAIGDSGMGTPEQSLVASRMAREPAALLIHTGDVAYPIGSFATYQAYYFEVYRELMSRIPFFPSLGNHDVEGDLGIAYKSVHSLPSAGVPDGHAGHYYSFDWGAAHFVALDSTLLLHETAVRMQLQWLERDLQRTRKPWRIAYWHHPPYDPVRGEGAEARTARERALPILERYGVQLVLNGHAHAYERTKPMLGYREVEDGLGITYVTTGGGGASLHGTRPGGVFAVSESIHHYVAVEVQATRLVVRATSATGDEVDSFTISPKPSASSATVVNTASFLPALAPGSLITVFGQNLAFGERAATAVPLPRELAGARLSISDRDLPLTLVSPGQINAQLPFAVPETATLRITNANGVVEVPLRVSETAPGIFIDEAATPVVVLPDGGVVSPTNPAEPGDLVTIHLTGLGTVEGDITEGEAAPATPLLHARAPVRVQIGSRQMPALFAGLAPGQVGVYHVIFSVPADMFHGTWPLRVLAGGAMSNDVWITVGRRAPAPDEPVIEGPLNLARAALPGSG